MKYREKTYYFSSEEAREQFIEQPETFLSHNAQQPPTVLVLYRLVSASNIYFYRRFLSHQPPLRLCILGARGAGKTLHGRQIAEKLGVFHICFETRLHEMILPKIKGKRLGWKWSDEIEEDFPTQEEIDEALKMPE